MSNPIASNPCPRCGTSLPAADCVVCPACDAILRPDPDLEETRKEGEKGRHFFLMALGAIIVFAGMFNLSGGDRIVPLVLAGAYVAAFQFSSRRTTHPVRLMALSVLVWLGFCALLLGVLFVGCLVVSGGRFGG